MATKFCPKHDSLVAYEDGPNRFLFCPECGGELSPYGPGGTLVIGLACHTKSDEMKADLPMLTTEDINAIRSVSFDLTATVRIAGGMATITGVDGIDDRGPG